MTTVSLCMIVRDEEAVLGRCLASAAPIADEIIIVDTGSTDGTKAIAAAYGARMFDFEWVDDFAAARNFSFAQAKGDFIMWLDADDVLPDAERAKFAAFKRSLPDHADAVLMPYWLAFDDAGRPTVTTRRCRLVRRGRGFRWHGRVHEYLDISGAHVVAVDIGVAHYRTSPDHSDRNLRIYERIAAETGGLKGRDLYYYANELADAGRFREAADAYRGFLQEPAGYREDKVTAALRLSDCCRRLGDPAGRIDALLRSFLFDAPHAEVCCALGGWFEEAGDWRTAAYWYERALDAPLGEGWLGVVNNACRTWLPHARLCICYGQQGRWADAAKHNEAALKWLPEDAGLIANKRILEAKLQEAAAAGAMPADSASACSGAERDA